MAKLYAELTSDKGGRVASKSGDKSIVVKLVYKNKAVAYIAFDEWGDEDEPFYALNIYKDEKLTQNGRSIPLP